MSNFAPGFISRREETGLKSLLSHSVNRILCGVSSLGFVVFFLFSVPGFAAVAPDLGAAFGYSFLGTNGIPTSGTVTCTTSTIDGNVGTTGNSITNTGPCTITGNIDAPVTSQVVMDFDDAYDDLDALNPVCDGVIPTTTTTLVPGTYCSAAGTTIGAGVTITLDGNASDVWVFKVGTGGLGALTGTGPGFEVVLDGAADACNVYWWTAEGATLTDASFVGTILSGAAVTMTDTIWTGRGMATTDATATDSELTFAGCAAPAAAPTAIPSLSVWAMIMLATFLAVFGLTGILRSKG